MSGGEGVGSEVWGGLGVGEGMGREGEGQDSLGLV